MIIKPTNLLQHLNRLDPWDVYHFAHIALMHYFPESYDEYGASISGESRDKEAELLEENNFDSWESVIIKFQNEIGYNFNELEVKLIN